MFVSFHYFLIFSLVYIQVGGGVLVGDEERDHLRVGRRRSKTDASLPDGCAPGHGIQAVRHRQAPRTQRH